VSKTYAEQTYVVDIDHMLRSRASPSLFPLTRSSARKRFRRNWRRGVVAVNTRPVFVAEGNWLRRLPEPVEYEFDSNVRNC
jgi:hypothetical protein